MKLLVAIVLAGCLQAPAESIPVDPQPQLRAAIKPPTAPEKHPYIKARRVAWRFTRGVLMPIGNFACSVIAALR